MNGLETGAIEVLVNRPFQYLVEQLHGMVIFGLLVEKVQIHWRIVMMEKHGLD